jgi:cytochrome P450
MEKMTDEVEYLLGKGAKDAWKIRDSGASLPYTSSVANEILHHKPPVPMIPHISKKSSFLGGHHIEKGSVVIPSIFYAARVSGSSTEFLPEREDADTQFVKCVTFGGGQHKCPGRRYAESLLSVFLTVVSSNYRFERVGPRPDEDDFIYFPTLFPAKNDFLIKERAQQKIANS